MRVDGCWRRKKNYDHRDLVLPGERGVGVGWGGTSWKEGSNEDDEDELTERSGVMVPYSVLLLFTAPGSFSCNLKGETQ